MPQNRRCSFSFIFCFLIDHVFFFPNAPFFLFSESNGKNGAFQKNRAKKSGALRKKARDHLKNRKCTENEHLRFWGILKKMHMPSHDKFLFQMLFEAFHDTPRTWIYSESFV